MAVTVCERFHAAVELIGARWTGAILQVLLRGRTRYADLRAAVPEISDRMLSERLRALERAGIVVRHVSAEPPVRVDYELTAKGRALEPALDAIGAWAHQWVERPSPGSPLARENAPRRVTPDRAPRAKKRGAP